MARLFILIKLRVRLISLHHFMNTFISSFIQVLDSSNNIEIIMFYISIAKMQFLLVCIRHKEDLVTLAQFLAPRQ